MLPEQEGVKTALHEFAHIDGSAVCMYCIRCLCQAFRIIRITRILKTVQLVRVMRAFLATSVMRVSHFFFKTVFLWSTLYWRNFCLAVLISNRLNWL